MNEADFEIRGVPVGGGAPCYVIAEAGSNHLGQLPVALALVDAAAQAGAQAVKFQTFEARRLYPENAGTSDYLGDPRSIYSIIESMEMPPEWLPALAERAHERGLAFISSPFHEEAVELLAPWVDAFKIASYELTHYPLLDAVAAQGKPVILSSGAADLGEVREAVTRLQTRGCSKLALLQCTAAYPAPPESINALALVTLREALGLPAGLSDHSRDPVVAPSVAAALGAAILEKHFTLSNELPGPDHAFAVEPRELAQLVAAVRSAQVVRGHGRKVVDEVEQELRAFARRSVMTIAPVSKGQRFSRATVDVLRHGKLAPGLPPKALDQVLGSCASRDIPALRALSEEDLAPLPGEEGS